MSLYENAVLDAKKIRESALHAARTVMAESLRPKIDSIVNESVSAHFGEGADDMEYETEAAEDLELESLFGEVEDEEPAPVEEPVADDELEELFSLSEMADEDELEEAADEDELDEAALEEALRGIAEAAGPATSDFGDIDAPEEHIDPASGLAEIGSEYQAGKEAGTVANVQKFAAEVRRVRTENAKLRKLARKTVKENSTLRKTNGKLYGALKETNLFNAKVVYTQKVLRSLPSANAEGLRKQVAESFDRAKSVDAVKIVAETWKSTLKNVLAEGRRVPSSSRSTGPSARLNEGANKQVLSESWKRIAGIVS